MSLQQPSVIIYGIEIGEPVTTLTGLMISGVCLYAYIQLGKLTQQNRTLIYLRYYFLIMSLATANGAILGHAFLPYLSFSWKLVGWILSMLSIMLIERASIEYTSALVSDRLAWWLKLINLIELLLFMTLTMITLKFFYVEAHTFYGLLVVVASLHFFVFLKTQSEGSKKFLTAVGFAAVSALIFMNEWGISKWFNHSDISHVLLTVAAWYFYHGARKMSEEKLQLTP
ncbi:MAG: hypothetical protein HC830_09250 [Bacteroidetes bacterium]|nr:hypothetical protein [Bacteroidota bacterium]